MSSDELSVEIIEQRFNQSVWYDDSCADALTWLLAKVKRQQKLLVELEWAGGTYCDESACGICGWTTGKGHKPGCELAGELYGH